MSEVVIKVDGLGKRYRIGRAERYRTIRESLMQSLSAPFRHRPKKVAGSAAEQGRADEMFWALQNVSFDVKQGEVVGIIGRNGAGKSTLLKVLSRITRPTKGYVELTGRVASLLEVGTGFHPELTGRENIYLNGAILSMSRAEVRSKFDEIVAFSELEKFLDTPVKRYSSGMYTRLAFAVAAHLDPEILMVDEVLAVGDAMFQKKCLGRMGDVARKGRTVLFVSHDMRAIRRLCTSAVYLKEGTLAHLGPVGPTVDMYASDAKVREFEFPVLAGDVTVHRFQVVQRGLVTDHLEGSVPFTIDVDFETTRDLTGFRLGVYVKTPLGDTVMRSFLADWDAERETVGLGWYTAHLEVPGRWLMPGTYRIVLHASRYGVGDYLDKFGLEQGVVVEAPVDFNPAHMGEPIDAAVILDRSWDLARTGRL